MIRCVEHYPTETIVIVRARLRRAMKRVINATIHNYEFEIYEVHKVGDLTERVPFTVYDAENTNREFDYDEEDLSSNSSGDDDNSASSPVDIALSDHHDFISSKGPKSSDSRQMGIGKSISCVEKLDRSKSNLRWRNFLSDKL